jgi:hypothetical protein
MHLDTFGKHLTDVVLNITKFSLLAIFSATQRTIYHYEIKFGDSQVVDYDTKNISENKLERSDKK